MCLRQEDPNMVENDVTDDLAGVRVMLRGVHGGRTLEQWSRHPCIRAVMARSAFLAVRALDFPVAVGQGIGTWLAVCPVVSDPA
jgi:hypothetical protein